MRYRLPRQPPAAAALAASREVRTELVDDLRAQMDEGAYMSPEKLNLAIYRMLKDVLR